MRAYLQITIATSFLLASCVALHSNEGVAQAPRDMRNQNQNAYLHVDGRRLVSADGHKVSLQGINLGGWLVTENWMCGFTDSKDTAQSEHVDSPGRSALESLETRFGAQRAASLMAAWQDHWVTAKDLDAIHQSGFNLIRVPISYRTLQHADGSWIRNARGQIDFKRMDWIVEEASKRGMYTIFDLHVWPDQRVGYNKIGKPEGRAILGSMAAFWTAIATHYRGNGAIAAFDLINEFPGAWGVQQVLSQAVRDGDPKRVQVVEGFSVEEFAKLREAGAFPNAVFSEHLYGHSPLSVSEIQARLKETSKSPFPVYIGEFLASDFGAATQVLNHAHASWSSWTYKTVNMGSWGVFNYSADLKTDLQHDSFDVINARWSTELTAWQASGIVRDHLINDARRYADASPSESVLAN